jgi:flagellar motor switch protein FliN
MSTHKDAREHLAALLAEHLGRQLGQALAPEMLDAPAPGEAPGTLSTVLRLEGALNGECTVRLPAKAAGAWAGAGASAANPQGWLESLLDLSCEPLSEALFARYGRVRIHRLDENAPVSPPSRSVARLVGGASAEGGAKEAPALLVLADRDLEEALTRMGRAAAAAEASGLTHGNLGLVMDVELEVSLRFGQRQLSLREVLELGSGSVVELDSEVDQPVELILDNRVIARGEAVIVDGNYGVRITEVLHPVMY